MRSVTYSMGVSLDGYIAGPDGADDPAVQWQERPVVVAVTVVVGELGNHVVASPKGRGGDATSVREQEPAHALGNPC